MKPVLFKILLLCLPLVTQCMGGGNFRVYKAIIESGDNSTELKAVLRHYANETLKHRAACYLIGNMPGHYTYTGERARIFSSQLDSILNSSAYSNPYNDSRIIQKKVDSLLLHYPFSSFNRVADVKSVKADFLIANIDNAFELWENGHWAQHLDFEEFCETLLPYTYYNGYEHEDWRSKVRAILDDGVYETLDSFQYSSDMDHSPFWACKYMNGWLKNYYSRDDVPEGKVRAISQSALPRIPYGECDHFADIALIVMRSLGIPVMEDFTPQWPFRSLGHTWNVLISTDGRKISFGGCDVDPDVLHKPDQKMAKVYRRTYAPDSELIRLNHKEKNIPPLFTNVFMKDVTPEYMKTVSIKIRGWKFHHRYAYLAVFDNKEWKPVCFGRRTIGGYYFKSIGKDILYLPVISTEAGLQAIGNPFVIDARGQMHSLQSSNGEASRVVLTRKFFLSQRMHMYAGRVIGGRFEGSNDKDFINNELVHAVETWRNTWDSITVKPSRAYRYWRFVSPKDGLGNMAEIEFYGQGGERVNGRVIGTDGSYSVHDTTTNKYAVFDGDPLTYYDMPRSIINPWVGMDFGQPVQISAIRFLPRNDDNNIRPGDEYELVFWSEGRWRSLGRQTANGNTLTYDNVPSNALLLLHDLSRGKEERPFTMIPNPNESDHLIQRWW